MDDNYSPQSSMEDCIAASGKRRGTRYRDDDDDDDDGDGAGRKEATLSGSHVVSGKDCDISRAEDLILDRKASSVERGRRRRRRGEKKKEKEKLQRSDHVKQIVWKQRGEVAGV
ncbi:hypothetical protein F2P81_000294 [Scophthalmus maximus]|uniref:Uncharacterized protein n=1 Tax=Scophthalmus maximus TaxID=52904 RepID=A0A6A4TVG0_SCOMX|nr:hypothetical protein F2P81_000294 [Scophthalmus maximus]